MNLNALILTLKSDEGRKVKDGRHQLYQCPAGCWTIGYGRNLEANGISEVEAVDLVTADCIQAFRDAAELVPNWLALDDVRQGVLANMAFNLGKERLAKFVHLLAAVNEMRFSDAAGEMRNSVWYGQVAQRAERLAVEMELGAV